MSRTNETTLWWGCVFWPPQGGCGFVRSDVLLTIWPPNLVKRNFFNISTQNSQLRIGKSNKYKLVDSFTI
ncbi:hypothetical protein GWI33_005247 [Rhynchophorus ferrugineus]|uniref:Uncharacterized protein n=1 Tax=Rhynchophorus ferrugineus TaxID=354439 RepID=A0A834IKH2_RHYFE|nr:hypothetical protein GWI33_005247 [Rhynchophorus ferrugineus]